MKIRKRPLELLKETFFEAELPGGLRAVVIPKPGLTQKTAILATKYGSLDIEFDLDGRRVSTPAGVAHFLEHQLFKKHGGDALMEFSKYGASSNAFTDYTMTAYYFVCSDNFDESLGELCNLVFRPEFEAGRVENEKGIIKQELLMYLDMPDMKGYHNLVASMYRRHPVRIDIGGTVESIQEVTPAILNLCYGAFYRPANMILVMAGDLDPQKTLQSAMRKVRPAAKRKAPDRGATFLPEEPGGVAERRVTDRMVVSRPRVMIGFKDRVNGEGPLETARRDLTTQIALDLIFGRSSAYFTREYESGLINDEFSASYSASPTFGFSVVGTETESPDRFVESVRKEIERASRRRFATEDLKRIQRKVAGRFITAFDSPESAAFVVLESLHRRIDLQAMIDLVMKIRPADLLARLEHLCGEDYSVSIVEPK